jgi:hypothetical protein
MNMEGSKEKTHSLNIGLKLEKADHYAVWKKLFLSMAVSEGLVEVEKTNGVITEIIFKEDNPRTLQAIFFENYFSDYCRNRVARK